MAANLQTLDKILKEHYLPAIRRQLNDTTVLLQRLRRDTENVYGREYVIALSYGRNEGVGARPEGGILPTPQSQKYDNLKLKVTYNYGRIKVTGPVIAATRRDVGAFVRAVESEMRGLLRDLRKDINRQLFGDGSGVLAVCGTTSNSTTVQLAATADMRNFRVGMVVDILAIADGTPVATGVTITAIDRVNKTITISGAPVTTSASHAVYRTGNYGAEIIGLDAWLGKDNNTIGGIDRTTAEWFRPNILHNSGTPRALSLDLMQQAEDAADIAASGRPSLLITSHAVRREYLGLLEDIRRFVNTQRLDGGWEAVMYNDKPLVVDPDCQEDRIYFIDESTFAIGQMSDFDWMDRDGAVLHRTANEDAYEATLFWYSQLGCDTPAANSVLTDIQVS